MHARPFRRFAIVSLVLAAALLAAPAAGEEPASVREVRELVPPNAAGVVRIDTKALAKDAQALLAELRKVEGANADEEGMATMQALVKLAGTVDSITAYFPTLDGSVPPIPTVVLRTNRKFADLYAEFAKDLPKEAGLPKLLAGENGRFAFAPVPAAPPIAIVDGTLANDLQAGVIVIGLAPLMTPQFIQSLGQNEPQEFAKLVGDVQHGQPIWGFLTGFDQAEPETPERLSFWLNPAGNGDGMALLKFATIERTAASLKSYRKEAASDEVLGRLMDVAQHDDTLVIQLTKGHASFPARVAKAVADLRAEARKAESASNLNTIFKLLVLHEAEHEVYPASLADLAAKADFVSLSVFDSPVNGVDIAKDAKKLPEPALLDYVYIQPNNAMPIDLLIAYERPEIYDNEGAFVLHFGGNVEWLGLKDFEDLLAKTKKWHKDNGT